MKVSTLVTLSLAALLMAVTLGGCASPTSQEDAGSGAGGPGGDGGDGLGADGASSTTDGGSGGSGGGSGDGADAGSDGGSGDGSGDGSDGSDGGAGDGSGDGEDDNASGSDGTSTTSGSASGSTTSSGSGAALGPDPVDLGSASSFAILAQTGITTTGTTHLTGDLGVSPIAGTSMTGFTLVMDGTNQFATSPLVTGKVYAADYASPTPAKLTQAISDMHSAAEDAAGRNAPTASELGTGAIGGMTFEPGLYTWSTGVTIGSDIVLSGDANDVWIFQVAQTLNAASGVQVTLSGGAKANNVFWQVGEQVTLGTDSEFKGNLITETAIVMNTGASLVGRALAGTAVTLDANTVTRAT